MKTDAAREPNTPPDPGGGSLTSLAATTPGGVAARVGTARAASERALRLTATAWGLAWMVSLAATLSSSPDLTVQPTLILIALGALFASWLLLAFVRAVPTWQFVIVASMTAVVNAWALNLDSLTSTTLLLTTWLNLATIQAALLMRRRLSVLLIGSVSAAILVILTVRLLTSDVFTTYNGRVVTAFAYAVSVGMAALIAATTLRQAGDTADASAAELRLRLVESAERRSRHDEVMRVSRLLHDTCINTLGAIRNGSGLRDPDAVRARCADDLVDLTQFANRTSLLAARSVEDLALEAQRQGRLKGISVDTHIAARHDLRLNPHVWRAAVGATREALINVAKHSGQQSARVHIAEDANALVVTVSDDGVGWNGLAPQDGGIERSIRARVHLSGGSVDILTREYRGTSVVMTWPGATSPTLTPPPERVIP